MASLLCFRLLILDLQMSLTVGLTIGIAKLIGRKIAIGFSKCFL